MLSHHGKSLVAGGITLALLTGCSGGGNVWAPDVGGAIHQVAAVKNRNRVESIYRLRRHGPAGVASDIKGDLYVADLGNSRVKVYAAGFASPPTILSVPGQHPSGVDSFSNGAYVAVANEDTAVGGQGSVSIFKGSTLQNTIKSATLYSPDTCAFDAT